MKSIFLLKPRVASVSYGITTRLLSSHCTVIWRECWQFTIMKFCEVSLIDCDRLNGNWFHYVTLEINRHKSPMQKYIVNPIAKEVDVCWCMNEMIPTQIQQCMTFILGFARQESNLKKRLPGNDLKIFRQSQGIKYRQDIHNLWMN